MSIIPEHILEEIQARNDIVEVINRYFPLKRTGANFKALCPFHTEKTPSFVVSPSKQIFHCFGCGAGGNVFGFVMQYERLSFPDAVRLLAARSGIVIQEKTEPGIVPSSKGLLDINKFALESFCEWLHDPKIGQSAYSYLKGRGLKDEVINKFQLGYAPCGNELLKKAKKQGLSIDLLEKAGLVVSSDGSLHDMFRGRLMFPVFNVIGKAIGFSGRVLDNSLPKYINTPETEIFHKGKVLYGLHASKSEMIKNNTAVICEGHFDFLRLYQEGVCYATASQGTAFTMDHVHLLRRYTEEIVVSFDSDSAGNKAALAGLEMFLEEGLHVRILSLPEPHDPDTYVKDNGIDAFRKLIAEARDILEVKLERLCGEYSPLTIDGKLKVTKQLLSDIAKIKNEIWKRQFIKKVAARLNIPEDSLWIELKKLRGRDHKEKEQPGSSDLEKIIKGSQNFAGEQYLVRLLLDDEPIPRLVREELDLGELQSSECRQILELVIGLKSSGKWKGLRSLLSYIKDDNLMKLLSQLTAGDVSCQDEEKAVRDCLYRVKRRYRENRIKVLIGDMERCEKDGSPRISGLIEEVNLLRNELRKLEQNFREGVLAVSAGQCGGHNG